LLESLLQEIQNVKIKINAMQSGTNRYSN